MNCSMAKKIFFLIIGIFLWMPIDIYATTGDVISSYILQDNQEISVDSVIFSISPFTLSAKEGVGAGDWEIQILNKKDVYDCVKRIYSSETCAFDPKEYIDYWRNEAGRIYDNAHNWNLFSIKIMFSKFGNILDETELRLAYLPSCPEIRNIEYTYEYDWNLDSSLEDSCLSMDVESKNADKCIVNIYPSINPQYSHIILYLEYAFQEPLQHIEFDADWEEVFKVGVLNEFGFVEKDTMYCVKSYIYDEKVLNRIKEIEEKYSGINDLLEESSLSFTYNGQDIKFDQAPDYLCIYNISGIKIIDMPTPDNIVDVSMLEKGIYIINYIYNSQKFIKKINKL